VTCSFPVFALCLSRCTEFEFLELFSEVRNTPTAKAPDNEGAILLMSFDDIGRLIDTGTAHGRSLVSRNAKWAFELQMREDGFGTVTLSDKDLHPMAMYRLALLAELFLK